ncbi:CHC2 zinc finger domain-containing protein [Shinella sp.]|uniref:CHC2 zinc finger domain-containing protein n=1 Tax=Shinella sp. TaxID=1870904 RepID=UPI003F6F8594
MRLFDNADITAVASKLGLQLDARKRSPQKAICPFHEDSDPSLYLYRATAKRSARDHYHCFVCGAHGDVISLIQNIENRSFWQAVERLAEFEGVNLSRAQRDTVDKLSGAKLLARNLSESSTGDEIAEFARQRGFTTEFLQARGIGAFDLRSLINHAQRDRLVEEQLMKAGIVRREELDGDNPDLYGTRVRGFFYGKRIVIPVHNSRGDNVGFVARALDDTKPKYLYTYDFPKRDILFGEKKVTDELLRRIHDKNTSAVDLYLVEGVFDVLRLEALGFLALGLLGAQMTSGQIDSLKRILDRLESIGQIRIHVFLDRDDAGFRGAHDAILRILPLLRDGLPFAIDAIWPNSTAGKLDPDTFLIGRKPEEATKLLNNEAIPALQFLAGFRVGADPRELDWKSIGRLRMASVARQIALSARDVPWRKVNLLSDSDGDDDYREFTEFVYAYGGADDGIPSDKIKSKIVVPATDTRSDLLTALTLGRSSTVRREYPLDDDSWDRLAVAASPLFHVHSKRLEMGDGPSAPFLAREVPKGGGRYRLKCGPAAYDALLQQYALMELLRDRDECPAFASQIPAVRYSSERPAGTAIYKTGLHPSKSAVSFAYQIDMSVVNGLIPPRREGIFRPYFECWRSFVDYIDACIQNLRYNDMQILRLDIAGFYDFVKKDVVSGSLVAPIELALQSLATSDGDVASFAPLFRPNVKESAAERAESFTSFLMSHSFGYQYRNPTTGEIETANSKRGIPQGPDLSAYLANISLFDLDEMMEGEIAFLNDTATKNNDGKEQSIAAAYARYVDDIVIVCKDIETASHLRRKIEARVNSKGLSLNRKNVVPPPMTRSEARAWVTDNRSGFGFSGPLADLPEINAMDPLADAGEVDRKTALGLIFDPELDNLNNPDNIIQKIALALRAEDIRFSDRANAFRRLWCLAAYELCDTSTGIELAEKYLSMVRACETSNTLQADPEYRRDLIMASLEGLDRALRASCPPGALPEEVQRRIEGCKQQLSDAVLDNVFDPIIREIASDDQLERHFMERYDTRCQIALTACIAAQITMARPASLEKLRHLLEPGNGMTLLPESIRNSLLRFDQFFASPVGKLMVSRQSVVHAVSSRLDQTVSQLQRLAIFGEAEEPPVFEPAASADPNELVQLANEILQIWSPSQDSPVATDTPIPPATDIELDAASSLVNIAHSQFAGIAARRTRFRYLIAGTVHATPIPSPPGLETAGILLWCNGSKLVLASTRTSSVAMPGGVTWQARSENAVDGVTLREAVLPKGYVLLANVQRNWGPAEIAALYRAGYTLFVRQLSSENDVVPVPTAFCFFVKLNDEVVDFPSLKLICWSASRASVDGHAFVRNGNALEAKSVFSDGADLWRLGWAVRDVCERTEVSTDHDGGLETHATTVLDKDSHRREAIISRVLPRLSGADRWGPGRSGALDVIPTRIERALSLLERFSASPTAAEAATCLLAAVAEGMYMSERLDAEPHLFAPGGPSMLMVKAAQRVSRALPEVTKHWPAIELISPPYRRTTISWHTLSRKVAIASNTLDAPISNSLEVLSLSLETLAAVTDLRALAFEICSNLSRSSLELLGESEIELGWLSDAVGDDLLLIEGENSPHSDINIKAQSKNLLALFSRIASGGRGLGILRDRITPAGWVTVIAVLLQVAPLRQAPQSMRPHLWQMSPERLKIARAALYQLLIYFSAAPDDRKDIENWPWDMFGPSFARRPRDIAEILKQITESSNMEVLSEISGSNPRTGDSQTGRPILRLADGSSIGLSEWQIDVSHIRGERGSSTEASSVNNRIQFIYSVSRIGEQVLGVHLVSQQLAHAAFTGSLGLDNPSANQEDNILPDVNKAATTVETNSKSLNSPLPETPRPNPLSDALSRIRAAQLKSWRARRGTKNANMHRVALVQWDVTDTYYSPGRKAGILEGLVTPTGEASTASETFARGGVFLSRSEARRRALIKEVLNSCTEFGVDGLVLPEYSLRPETVNWLSRQLKQRALPLTVWCGTFRIPDGTQLEISSPPNGNGPYRASSGKEAAAGLSKLEHHTAMLTCLKATQTANEGIIIDHFLRQKRYPSSAAGELIRPPVNLPWRPLLQDETSPFNLGAFTLELICSEMFPHASSANFIGIVEENNELAERYGLPRVAETFKHISNDIFEFAKWTAYRNVREVRGDVDKALIRGDRFQRTLIILPAMTNRSADYHIFGQNQYLAAGLVTVFCNAVAPPVGCGQSGFIGLDGWKQTEAIHTPYGSQAPGIFQLGGKHSGPLGTTEAAMVIADLDLLRTADQRPRPHYQQRSLRLVAHLPLIFSTETVRKADDRGESKSQRVPRIRHLDDSTMNTERAFSVVADALDSESDWRANGNYAHHLEEIDEGHTVALQKIRRGLKVLEAFADDPTWLRKRTSSFLVERYEYPPMSPLPALVDWIYVDDNWSESTVSVQDEDIDAFSVDAPYLTVPRSIKDEPPHQ